MPHAASTPHERLDPLRAEAYLKAQPQVRREHGASARIRRSLEERGEHIVVLDDDPTGTQSVHHVHVLTSSDHETLRWALESPERTFFLLTNSRSVPGPRAARLARDVVERVLISAREVGTRVRIASRSDSTLRGHFPAETDAVCDALARGGGGAIDGVLVCPCFVEAGRITVDDVHWVRRGETMVPAAQTEYAADPVFGYSSSNLREWISQKMRGRVAAADVTSIGLADIRLGGPDRVAEILDGGHDGAPIAVNAATYEDLEIIVLGLLAAEDAGRRFVYRTGPSFVRVRGGIEGAPPVTTEQLYAERPRRGHGLVVVGSFVSSTTEQLRHLLELSDVHGVELVAERVIGSVAARRHEILRVVAEVTDAIADCEVVVYTSREMQQDPNKSAFDIQQDVSESLVDVVRRLRVPLGYLVVKGGITSSDIATQALGVRRARVLGQMQTGIIPVWLLPDDSAFPGMPYVIFPGNVGDVDSLLHVLATMRGASSATGSDGPAATPGP